MTCFSCSIRSELNINHRIIFFFILERIKCWGKLHYQWAFPSGRYFNCRTKLNRCLRIESADVFHHSTSKLNSMFF